MFIYNYKPNILFKIIRTSRQISGWTHEGASSNAVLYTRNVIQLTPTTVVPKLLIAPARLYPEHVIPEPLQTADALMPGNLARQHLDDLTPVDNQISTIDQCAKNVDAEWHEMLLMIMMMVMLMRRRMTLLTSGHVRTLSSSQATVQSICERKQETHDLVKPLNSNSFQDIKNPHGRSGSNWVIFVSWIGHLL